MSKFLSNPNTGWEVISEKCQECKCFNHCPTSQTQWKHMLASSLTPSWPHLSCYHVTSHLNSPSKNVTSHLTVISQEISNYNILLATIPTIKDTQFKKRKYNSTLIIKSPHKDKPKNWQKAALFSTYKIAKKIPHVPWAGALHSPHTCFLPPLGVRAVLAGTASGGTEIAVFSAEGTKFQHFYSQLLRIKQSKGSF